MSPNTIDQHDIRIRAHELWQERGCPVGSAEVDWMRAESELRAAAKKGSDRAPASSQAPVRNLATRAAAPSAARPKTRAG